MKRTLTIFLALVFLMGAACLRPSKVPEQVPPGPSLHDQKRDALPAIAALRASEFDKAHRLAEGLCKKEGRNAYGRVVRAITAYKKTMRQLFMDATVIAMGAWRSGFNGRYAISAVTRAEAVLAQVGEDLAMASRQPKLSLELCLACLKVDWNKNGRVDQRDRRFLEIERDAAGKAIPQDDPRRRPVFRFDHGDFVWAQAFVSFQRAVLHLFLAYDWPNWSAGEIINWAERDRGSRRGPLVIKLARPKHIAMARRLILEGVAYSDEARRSYLAERDDDREWLPNPQQKSHPLPLPVDEALYATWAGILRDVKGLVRGDEGLSVGEMAQLGDHTWKNPPGGYLNLGRMLSKPRDIVFQSGEKVMSLLRYRRRDTPAFEKGLKGILGDYYVSKMKPSPLLCRLRRMKNEVQSGKESFDRKIRYLLWVN